MPAGRTFFSRKIFSSGSNEYLFRLPLGVSTTTRSASASLSMGLSHEGFAKPFRAAADFRFRPIAKALIIGARTQIRSSEAPVRYLPVWISRACVLGACFL